MQDVIAVGTDTPGWRVAIHQFASASAVSAPRPEMTRVVLFKSLQKTERSSLELFFQPAEFQVIIAGIFGGIFIDMEICMQVAQRTPVLTFRDILLE